MNTSKFGPSMAARIAAIIITIVTLFFVSFLYNSFNLEEMIEEPPWGFILLASCVVFQVPIGGWIDQQLGKIGKNVAA